METDSPGVLFRRPLRGLKVLVRHGTPVRYAHRGLDSATRRTASGEMWVKLRAYRLLHHELSEANFLNPTVQLEQSV